MMACHPNKLRQEDFGQRKCRHAPALQQLFQESAQLADANARALALVQRTAHARLHRHTHTLTGP